MGKTPSTNLGPLRTPGGVREFPVLGESNEAGLKTGSARLEALDVPGRSFLEFRRCGDLPQLSGSHPCCFLPNHVERPQIKSLTRGLHRRQRVSYLIVGFLAAGVL